MSKENPFISSSEREVSEEIRTASVREDGDKYKYSFNPVLEAGDPLIDEIQDIFVKKLPWGSPKVRVNGLARARRMPLEPTDPIPKDVVSLEILKSTSKEVVSAFFKALNETGKFNLGISGEQYPSEAEEISYQTR